MACELCSRSNCTRSFHSIEEQSNFDDVADEIKDRAKTVITNRLNRVEWIEESGEVYIKLSDAIEVVQDYE